MSTTGRVARAIQQRLTRPDGPLHPVQHLAVVDNSHLHSRHAAAKALGGVETHFHVTLVSGGFAGLALVKRHALVYRELEQQFQEGLHSLQLVTKTPEEWAKIHPPGSSS